MSEYKDKKVIKRNKREEGNIIVVLVAFTSFDDEQE